MANLLHVCGRESWPGIDRSLGKPAMPGARELAFRCALASRSACMLEKDAQLLNDAAEPGYPAISPMVNVITP
jgi:hypothetical protein